MGDAFASLDPAAKARYLELLRSIARPDDVAVDAQPNDEGRWTLTITTSDRLGTLSVITGLLAAYGIDIASVDVFTLRFSTDDRPGRRPRSRRRPRLGQGDFRPSATILDIFDVSPSESQPGLWDRFRGDLGVLIAQLVSEGIDSAREAVIERVADAFRRRPQAESQLLPMAVSVSNDESPYSRIAIRGSDTQGFLFAFANALAMLRVNVERAEIRTIGAEVEDTFWVTDQRGRRIESEERLSNLRVGVALIKHFTHLLPRSPDPAQALRQFHALTQQTLSEGHPSSEIRNLRSPQVLEILADLMGISEFLWEDFLRMQHESLFPVLTDTRGLERRLSKAAMGGACRKQASGADGFEAKVRVLNQFKDREMFRIDLRHITGHVGFRRFSDELTDLAEVVVEQAAMLVAERLTEQHGPPLLDDRRACTWCICAMGKFGGRELGFGSDIELIFVYEGEGDSQGNSPVANAQYFNDLVRDFTHVVAAQREGIFEIDLRLRPFGNAGALASTLDGFQAYYSESGQARHFERMAMVKLRPVAGDADLGERIKAARDRFVYSDAQVDFENIAHLRGRQAAELVPPGLTSAKHSRGGVVDIEYFVQAAQIEAGRLNASVRETNTLFALSRLAEGGYLSDEKAAMLTETYEFLRRLIDALRVVRGHARDLTLPDADSRQFAYLAQRLRFDSTASFAAELKDRMAAAAALWPESTADVEGPKSGAR